MPEQAKDQIWKDGVLISEILRTVSDVEIERRDMPALLRARLPVLRAWSNDAQDAAALTALTAGQRIARQAVIETRVAALAKIALGLIWNAGQDDGG